LYRLVATIDLYFERREKVVNEPQINSIGIRRVLNDEIEVAGRDLLAALKLSCAHCSAVSSAARGTARDAADDRESGSAPLSLKYS
jgi:hypothetical protein